MDLSTALICAVAALLGFNNLLFKIPGWERKRVFFWLLQAVNIATIIGLMAVGIPGFAGATHAINWVLGLLLVMHVVTNNGKLVAALRANDDESDAATAEKREQIKAALGKAALVRGSEE